MNAIQLRDRIDFYNDRYKSPRFADSNYMDAINSAINMLFKDKTDNKKVFRRYSFQSNEQVRRELYTLIKTATITPVSDVVTYPADFYYFGEMNTVVDGVVTYCKPTNFNEIGPLLVNPFKKPTPNKTYYIENNVGLQVYYGSGTAFTSAVLTYLKTPNTVSIGTEGDKISAGGTLTNGSTYMVYSDCVQNAVTYYSGQTFVAVGTALTSGTVILNSIIVNCDLPENVHDEVCKLASHIMNGTIEDYNKSAFMEKETEKQ